MEGNQRYLTDIIYPASVNKSPQRLIKLICAFIRCHGVCSNVLSTFGVLLKLNMGERGTGNGKRETGNGERGTGVWERVNSGNPPENSKWRRKQRLQTLRPRPH